MKRLQVQTVEGESIQLSYDYLAAEGQRYRVNGQQVIQSPRLAGGNIFELWVPSEAEERPYEIFRVAAGELLRLRDAPDVTAKGV